MKFRLNKILDLLGEILVLGIIFLVPVYFSSFFPTVNTFELGKMVIFKILTLLLAAVVSVKFISAAGESRPYAARLSARLKSWLIPVLFLSGLALATFFSIDQERSLFGLYERQLGLTANLYFFAFFAILVTIIKNRKQLDRILLTAVFSSAAVCAYGLAQKLGYDFMVWSEPISVTGRVTSALGQPNYLGAYLLLLIPLTVYFIATRRHLVARLFFVVILATQILNLVYVYSVSAWLSLMAGAAISALFYLLVNKHRLFSGVGPSGLGRFFRKSRVIAAAILILAGVGCWGIRYSDYLAVKTRALLDMRGAAGSRMLVWRASVDAIKDRPLLGYGPETQGDILTRYYTREWGIYNYVNARPNRSHNIILDILMTTGFVGLFAWLALIYTVYRWLYLAIRGGRDVLLPYMIILSLSGYLCSLLFNFSFITSEVYFWFLGAVALWLRHDTENTDGPSLDAAVVNGRVGFRSLVLKISALIAVLACCGYLVYRQAQTYIADYYYFGLQAVSRESDYFAVMQFYDYIKESLGMPNRYAKMAAMPISDFLLEIKDQVFRRPGKTRLLETLATVKADNYSNNLLRAKIYSGLADPVSAQYYGLAEEEFGKVIAASPEMPKNYYELAKFYSSRGDYDRAVQYYEIAISKLPDLADPLLNEQHRQDINRELYFYLDGLGDVYLYQKDYSRAIGFYKLAEEQYDGNAGIYLKILRAYYLAGNPEQAIVYGRKGYGREPENYTWAYYLALMHYEQKDYASALPLAEEAHRLNPQHTGVNDILRKLKIAEAE